MGDSASGMDGATYVAAGATNVPGGPLPAGLVMVLGTRTGHLTPTDMDVDMEVAPAMQWQ